MTDETFLNELNYALSKPSTIETPTLALSTEGNKSNFTIAPFAT